jgi:hypothetical protein
VYANSVRRAEGRTVAGATGFISTGFVPPRLLALIAQRSQHTSTWRRYPLLLSKENKARFICSPSEEIANLHAVPSLGRQQDHGHGCLHHGRRLASETLETRQKEERKKRRFICSTTATFVSANAKENAPAIQSIFLEYMHNQGKKTKREPARAPCF